MNPFFQPEVRLLDNDEWGYFYSPSQLEAIRSHRLHTMPLADLYEQYNVNTFFQRKRERERIEI